MAKIQERLAIKYNRIYGVPHQVSQVGDWRGKAIVLEGSGLHRLVLVAICSAAEFLLPPNQSGIWNRGLCSYYLNCEFQAVFHALRCGKGRTNLSDTFRRRAIRSRKSNGERWFERRHVRSRSRMRAERAFQAGDLKNSS